MPAMGNGQKLILAFVTLILGVVLIGVIATNALVVTAKTNVANETLDISSGRLADAILSINATYPFRITNYPTGWKTADCPITNFVFRNQTQATTTVATDYAFFPANGTLMLVNSSIYHDDGAIQPLNVTTMSYTYCGDDYMNLGWGRTVTNLVGGFFAIALLLTAVGLFYSIARDNGIISR